MKADYISERDYTYPKANYALFSPNSLTTASNQATPEKTSYTNSSHAPTGGQGLAPIRNNLHAIATDV